MATLTLTKQPRALRGALRKTEMEMNEKDMSNLRHMLGAIYGRYKKNTWGWRNYFCAGIGDLDSMRRLVAAGFATEGHQQDGGSIYFHATEAGCKSVGLGPSGIKRAFER